MCRLLKRRARERAFSVTYSSAHRQGKIERRARSSSSQIAGFIEILAQRFGMPAYSALADARLDHARLTAHLPRIGQNSHRQRLLESASPPSKLPRIGQSSRRHKNHPCQIKKARFFTLCDVFHGTAVTTLRVWRHFLAYLEVAKETASPVPAVSSVAMLGILGKSPESVAKLEKWSHETRETRPSAHIKQAPRASV